MYLTCWMTTAQIEQMRANKVLFERFRVTINKVIIAAVIPLSGCQKYYSMARNLTNASGANGSVSGSVVNRPQFAGGSKVSIDGAYGKK